MPRRPSATSTQVLTFGTFRLFPARNWLLDRDTPVRVGSRALDILTILAEHAGEIVSKEELMEYAWPNTTVVEANLRVHVAGLRKLLGDGQTGTRYIVSVIGRGYRFVAPVSLSQAPNVVSLPPASGHDAGLPAQLTRMIGRADLVAALSAKLPRRHFVTLVGPGGIGKTTVAVAVADGLAPSYRDGVRFVDLAPVANPLLVPSTLASALGLAIRSDDPGPGLIAFLRDKHMLIVLDNCEHVIAATAALAEGILKAAPRVNILATSREPVGAEGEVVQRLAPLAFPPRESRPTAADALTFPSIQLFVDRAAANLNGFEMSDEEALFVSDICCRLDGLPLAIELAASRVDAFGIGGLAALLNDRFSLLIRGRRTALPRHQTLGATLDWSYDTLTEPERVVLRRLAVFAASFTFESASAVTSGSGVVAAEVIDQLANLVAKSLVVADIGGANARYRLLTTTRVYASQKLAESGELGRLSRRHAEHCRELVERAGAGREQQSTGAWLIVNAEQIDDVRAALTWAFSPGGDLALGVALTVGSVPLWTHMSLNEECRAWVETALASLDAVKGQQTYDRLRLFAALGGAIKYTRSSASEKAAPWERALAIAEDTGNTDYQLRSLWGLWADNMEWGENRKALVLAEKFARVATASADPTDTIVADRMIGYTYYILGDLVPARIHIERMLRRYAAPANRLDIVRYQFDQRVMARIPLAGILWLQGFPDQAMRAATENIDEAREIDHEISLTYALAQSACPIALYVGDLDAAGRFLTMLLDRPSRHAMEPWERWGRCFKAVLLLRQGDLANGLRMLSATLSEFPANAVHMRHVAFLGELAAGLGRAGEVAAGLTTIERALDACRRYEENWCIAELLRIQGELLLQQGAADAVASGEACFRDALDRARGQGALSWELRVATSHARLWRDLGRRGDARDLLGSTYNRFTEGFATSDLTAAKTLLDELS